MSRKIKKIKKNKLQHPDVSKQLSLAIRHHNSGQIAQAENIYRQILAVQPNNIRANNYLGTIAIQTGHIDAAMQLFQKCIALKPDYADAYNNLGSCLMKSGQDDGAIEAFLKTVALDHSYVEAFYNLSALYEKKSNIQQARHYL